MELLQRLIFTAVSAAAIIYFIVKIKLKYWKNRGILHKKPAFFYGNLKGVGKKRHISQAIQEVYDLFKDTDAPFVGFYTFIRPTVLITKFELVQQIIENNSNAFEVEELYHNVQLKPLTIDVLELNNGQSSKMNTEPNPKLNITFPSLLRVADTFQDTLKQLQSQQPTFDICELVDCFNVDVIASLVLGLESNSLKYPNNEFRSMSKYYFGNRLPVYELLTQTYPYLAEFLNYKSFDPLQAENFWILLMDKQEEGNWNRNKRHTNLLAQLMDLMKEIKRKEYLNEQTIAAKAFSFVFGSLEHLNAALIFCLYELALNREVQETLRLEITKVLNKYNGKLSPESLKEMTYLEHVLKENQRLHPIVTFLVYTAKKDFEVPNSVFMLQDRNRLILPTMAIHRDPLIFADPLKFNPDRFSTENLHQYNAASFMPFSNGWHSFMDANFAEMQLSVALITILRQYRLSPCSDTEIPLQYDSQRVLLSAKPDVKLTFERIKS